MIILLLIVGALAFFWAVVLMQPSRRRQLTIWVSAGLVLAPILLLSVNDLYHVGFNIDETTELQPLAPMDDQLQISRRPIGTAKSISAIVTLSFPMQPFIPLHLVPRSQLASNTAPFRKLQ